MAYRKIDMSHQFPTAGTDKMANARKMPNKCPGVRKGMLGNNID